jgi:small-conductance mechanosensitive channel/CRP-like cAMP-binding protein
MAMIVGFILFLMALGARSASANRHIRGRLFASALVFAAYAGVAALLKYASLDAEMARQLSLLQPLLLIFGLAIGAVTLILNPWHADRLPDRFPTIVQDAIVIVLFAIAATAILQERVFAMTAVGAVVVGFALQDTLGNLFAGLAIQIEKPFRVGHWVNIAGKDGVVNEITWRATKIRTKAGNLVVVPNSVLARDTVTNYSEPSHDTCLEIDVGASYDTPPNEVKAVILGALRGEPLLSRGRDPEVLIVDFAASAITYRMRVWINDFALEERARDVVRSRVYYAFRRSRISIPYPIQVQIDADATTPVQADPASLDAVLRNVPVFAPLSDEQRAELRDAARPGLYAAGESIVRQGDPGSSMFVVMRGEAVVTLDTTVGELARFGPGAYFGEMSLLTGESRVATVTAVTDCELLEITLDSFRQFVMANPSAVDRIGLDVATRRAELLQHRSTGAAQIPVAEAPQTFLTRVRQFLKLAHTST